MTPLHWAVEREFTNIVQILLSHGADPHAISKFRKTPYSLAQAHNNVDILKLLAAATQLHESNLKQTQKATDSLVSEMQRFQKPKTTDPNPDSYEHMVDQDADIMQTPMDEYDGGNSLNDAIVQLQNVDASSKSLDASALQMLQDHGISLQDDQDNSMLTSALQSGRKLVLSEAGKLGLNDLKMGLKMPIIASSGSLVQRSVKLATNRFHPYNNASGSLITSTPTAGNQQSNKIVKILSAEEFKQMCGGDLSAAFRKTTSQEIKKNLSDDGQVK
jgi:GA-binding protein transcription factor, beta